MADLYDTVAYIITSYYLYLDLSLSHFPSLSLYIQICIYMSCSLSLSLDLPQIICMDLIPLSHFLRKQHRINSTA